MKSMDQEFTKFYSVTGTFTNPTQWNCSTQKLQRNPRWKTAEAVSQLDVLNHGGFLPILLFN